MRIGYARVSTSEQNLDLHNDTLKRAGCEKIIEDGSEQKDRKPLRPRPCARSVTRRRRACCLASRPPGSFAQHLIELMSELEKQKIEFQSLQESIDTTTPGGKLIFHMFGARAELERNLISDRTKAGLEAARARGRRGGRPKKLNAQQRELANDLFNQKKHGIDEICRSLGIRKPTLYAYISSRGRT